MKNNLQTQIYVFHYKPGPVLIRVPNYVHIWAGKNKSSVPCEYTGDDTGIHISEKNKYYSELTGIYWVWKNTKQDIVGSVHYRRYFTDQIEPFGSQLKRSLYFLAWMQRKRYGLIYTRNLDLFKERILTEPEITAILKDHDLILPQRRKFKYSVQTHYEKYHHSSDLRLLETLIRENCPEYLSALQKVLSGNRLFANNMFIMKWPDFDRFMNWQFHLLFEFERRIKLSDYEGYQERILGFIAERLLNVWVTHQNFRIKELPVIYFKHLKNK